MSPVGPKKEMVADPVVHRAFVSFITGLSDETMGSTWWDVDERTLLVGNRGDHASALQAARVEGEIGIPGEDVELGGRVVLEQVGYSILAFHPITAPTLVFATDGGDYQVFVEDADLARDEGIFADRLVSPTVVLADQAALLGEPWTAESRDVRFTVRGDEIVRGRAGAVVGSRASGLNRDSLPRAGDTDDSAGPELAAAARRARAVRPWMSRYGRVLQVLRGLKQAELSRGVRVSGFGYRVGVNLGEFSEHDTAPVVLAIDDEYSVIDVLSRRRFRVGVDIARAVESLSAAPDLHPLEAVARGLDIPVHGADAVLEVVASTLLPAGLELHPQLLPVAGRR